MSRLKAAPEAGLVFSEAMVQLGGRFTSATEFQGYDPLLYRCSLMAFALLRRYAEVRPSGELRSRAWRLAFRASSVGDGGATAGNVKLLLPPRQSRGISFVSLEQDDLSLNHHPALISCLSMIFFRKPVATFRDHALAFPLLALFPAM